MIDGQLTDVELIELGSSALNPAETGATILDVDDISDFSEDGGELEIVGETYEYVGIIEASGAHLDEEGEDAWTEPAQILLGEPLRVDVLESDPIHIWVGNQIASDVYAVVDLGGPGQTNQDAAGDSVLIPIAYHQQAVWPIRQYDPPWPVLVANDLSGIQEVPGLTPVIDGSIIDPGTLPNPEGPTEPPAESPLPSLVGNIRTLLGQFAAVPNGVTYEIHVAEGIPVADPDTGENTSWIEPTAPPGEDTLNGSTTATQFQVTKGPERLIDPEDETQGTTDELQAGVGYFVAVVAKNDIGSASPSAWVGPVQLRLAGNEEISADYAYLGDVTFDQMQGGTFSATVAWAGLLTTRTDEFGPGGELDQSGLRGFSAPENEGEPAPVQVEVPFDGRAAYFAGDIEARTLTAYQGSSFHGDANRIKGDGSFYAEAGLGGAVDGPQIAQSVPSVAVQQDPGSLANPSFWPNGVPITTSNCVGLMWDVDMGAFRTMQNTSRGVIGWAIRADGLCRYTGTYWGNSEVGGMVHLPGSKFACIGRPIGGTNYAIWTQGGTFNGFYNQVNAAQIPAIGPNLDDPNQVRIMEVYPGSSQIRVTRVNIPSTGKPTILGAAASPDRPWAGKARIGSVTAGTDMGLGPGFHHVYAHHKLEGSLIRVSGSHTAFTQEPDLEWRLPTACVGMAYKNTAEAQGWYALGADGKLYRFTDTNVQTGEKARHVAAVTMATSNAESQVGTKVEFDLQSRWSMTVTAPPLIDPATRAGIYMYRGSGTPIDADMVRQGYTQSGSRVLTIGNPTYSGAAPGTAPTAGAYPLVSPATVRSEATDSAGPVWQLSGDGSWRLGDLGGRDGATVFPSAPVPVSSPFSTIDGITVTRIGPMCIITGTFYRNSGSTTAWTKAATIPEGFRPPVDTLSPMGLIWSGTAGINFQLYIRANGNVDIRMAGTSASGMVAQAIWFSAEHAPHQDPDDPDDPSGDEALQRPRPRPPDPDDPDDPEADPEPEQVVNEQEGEQL